MEQYFVVHLSGLSSAAEDWLSQQAFTYGALGISEVLPFEQPEGEEDVFTKISDTREVDVYFAEAPQISFLESVRSHFPEVRLKVEEEDNRDWLAEWKKGFQPFPLVAGHWVVPSWSEPPKDAKHKIFIEPGMAFGTGTHETTKLVAGCLSELAKREKIDSLLDVGTGTGIIAILARQLGIHQVHCTEIEADSRRVAKENFARNSVRGIRLDNRQIQDLFEKYDVVLANIIDGVLVRIQDALKARLVQGGWLVLSGIIREREADFLAGFQLPEGKSWDLRRVQGDWILYAVKL